MNRIKITNCFPNKLPFFKSTFSFSCCPAVCTHTQSTDLRTMKQKAVLTQTTNKTPENLIVLTVVSLTYTVLHFITSYLSISNTSIIYSFIFIDKNHSGFVGAPRHLPATCFFPIIPLFCLTQTSKQLTTHNTNKLQAFKKCLPKDIYIC